MQNQLSITDQYSSLSTRFQTVANYALPWEVAQEMPLVDYRTVLNELAAGRHAPLFLTDMSKYVDDKETYGPMLAMVEGKHKSEFRLSIIKAQDGDNIVYMPVCEDMKTGNLLVVGAGEAFQGPPVRNLFYVDGSHEEAAGAINEFIEDAMVARTGNDTWMYGIVQTNEDLIMASSMLASLPMAEDGVVPAGTKIGECFTAVARGKSEVGTCVLARHFFDPKEAAQTIHAGIPDNMTVGKPLAFKQLNTPR